MNLSWKASIGAGEMTQQLTLSALPGDPGSITRTHMIDSSQSSLTPVPDLKPPSDHCGHQASMWCIDIHADKNFIHIKVYITLKKNLYF